MLTTVTVAATVGNIAITNKGGTAEATACNRQAPMPCADTTLEVQGASSDTKTTTHKDT